MKKNREFELVDPKALTPYKSNSRTHSEAQIEELKKSIQEFGMIENDDTFLTEWINVLPVVSSGWVFVWTAWRVLDQWTEITKGIGDMTNLVVWSKGGGGLGDLEGAFATDYELAMVFNRGAKLTGKRIGSVWEVGKDGGATYVHPTQKPVALAEMAFESCVGRGTGVLDLFGGSGSTLIACEKTKRKCFMMELDPVYIDVILTRWAQFTGKDPVREDGKLWSQINV